MFKILNYPIYNVCLFSCRYNPLWLYFHSPVGGFSLLVFEVLDHTQWRTTVGRTPLDELPIRHRDLYLTTQHTHNRQTSMCRVGFELTISAGERPKTYALERAATGNGCPIYKKWLKSFCCHNSHEVLYGGSTYNLYIDAIVVLAHYVGHCTK